MNRPKNRLAFQQLENTCDNVNKIIHFLRWPAPLLFLVPFYFFKSSLHFTSLALSHHLSFLSPLIGHIMRICKQGMNKRAFLISISIPQTFRSSEISNLIETISILPKIFISNHIR